MASLDKEGLYYVKEDPQLGKIRGLDPWAVENGIHLIRMEQDAAEGIMMIRKSNQQQYGTVHGGVLVAFADTIAQASGGVEGDGLPTTLENVFREDEVRPSMDRSLILKNVNGGENGCFVVRTRKQAAR